MRTKEGNKEKDILDAAVNVFAEYGYHNAKISKIAENAGVATGSVYVYYKNKMDILLKIFDNLWEDLYKKTKEIINTNKAKNPSEKIDLLIDVLFEIFSANPSLAIVFVNEQNNHDINGKGKFVYHYDKFLDLGELIIKEGIKSGVFSKEINPVIFRHYIFGAIRNLLHKWANEPKKFDIEEIRNSVKYLIKFGITK